jgi:hypothetical protein
MSMFVPADPNHWMNGWRELPAACAEQPLERAQSTRVSLSE